MQERWGESFQGYYDKLTEVIDCIAGQTLQSDGELIDATYFAISSGKTESSEDVWGGKLDYLVPVASPGDLFASGYQTTASFSAEEFRNAIQEKAPDADFSGDPSTWVGEAACTNSGSVKQITIGGQPVDGDDVRSAFGLRSSNFTLACADSIFTFTVRGYGHGVGHEPDRRAIYGAAGFGLSGNFGVVLPQHHAGFRIRERLPSKGQEAFSSAY